MTRRKKRVPGQPGTVYHAPAPRAHACTTLLTTVRRRIRTALVRAPTGSLPQSDTDSNKSFGCGVCFRNPTSELSTLQPPLCDSCPDEHEISPDTSTG